MLAVRLQKTPAEIRDMAITDFEDVLTVLRIQRKIEAGEE
jgi:hypothetical protein